MFFLLETETMGNESKIAQKESEHAKQEWGLGFGMRSASIIFNDNNDRAISLTPLLYYKGERAYLDGLEGGFHLYKNDLWQFSLFGKIRFFDIPPEYQNSIQGDTFDYGGRLRYRVGYKSHADLELITNNYGDFSAIARLGKSFDLGRLDWSPFMEVRYKNNSFNNRYYGLTWLGLDSIGSGVDYQFGGDLRYHITGNLYLLGSIKFRYLDESARNAQLVSSDWETKYLLGIGLFNNKEKALKKDIGIKPYMTIAHGWASPAKLLHILYGNFDKDEYNNQMTSIFYGHPLTNSLLGLPLDVYLTSGFAYHYKSEVQDSAQEFVLAVKMYYTIPLPIRIRIGFAEGVSYITNVTYIEKLKMELRGHEPSNLMNYLQFSYEINLGDLFRCSSNKDLWLGFSVHHRSSIFKKSQQFGDAKGGSNYPSIQFQYHF